MTANNIILAKPDANTSIDYVIPAGESANFRFGAEDISGLRLGNAGELIVSFVDGGQLRITNFEDYINNGNILELSDGTVVDPSLLVSGLDRDYFLNKVSSAAGSDSIEVIGQPASNSVQEISLVPGQKYACEFDPANAAKVEVRDGQMVLTFADGSQVVINNYSAVMAGDLPAELTLAEGAVIDDEGLLTGVIEVQDVEEMVETASSDEGAGEQVAQIEPAAGNESNVAQQLAQIEPAAGEQVAVSNSGYGFDSSPSSAPFSAGDAVGPIDPTALQYVIPNVENEVFPSQRQQTSPVDDRPIIQTSSAVVDETDFSAGALNTTGSVSVNYGNDGPGNIVPNRTVTITCNSVAGGALRTGGQDITITQTVDGYVGVITGSSPVVTVFEFTIDSVTGDYSYNQYLPFDHSDTSNDNEDICIDFGFRAVDSDGDRTNSSVQIRIFDDGPTVLSQIDKTVDETDMVGGVVSTTGQFIADAGQDGLSSYSLANPSTFNATGSVAGGVLTSNGNPVVVTLSGNTYTGTANGVDVFTMVLNPSTGEYTFTLLGPLDHADPNDPNDSIELNFDINITDGDGDTATGTVTVNVLDDGPAVVPTVSTVDETDLVSGVNISGNVNVDFGEDGAGSVAGSDTFTSSGSQLGGSLTSNGDPVVVTFNSTTGTYTGTAGGIDIFTMTINSDGSYNFELLGTLDHADPNDPNDIINLDFGVVVTDNDGDTDTSFVRVRVEDDVPVIGDSRGNVDESDFDAGPLVYTDSVDHDFGLEPGTITLNGNVPTGLTSNGNPVVVTAVGNTYTAVSNGVTIFTLTVNPATGQYTYTQFVELDHADPNDPNDILSLDFGIVITSTIDGSTDTGTITIDVADDAPVANDDINGAEEGQLITGNVVANDELSEDNPNIVTNVNFGGTNYTVPEGGFVNIITPLGTLTMHSDGTYQYISNNNDPSGVDQFTYTLVDNDGDYDTASLSITVTPDGQPVAVSELIAVDETNLTPGPMIFNDNLNVDFGIDGAGTVTANGGFTSGGSLLGGSFTSGGNPVVVTLSGNTYTGVANGVTVFTLQINTDGSYSFQLFDHIDHADGTDPNDIITLEFGVTLADADGDTADGTVTIHIHDDAPVAYDDAAVAVQESQTVTGNVTTNDEMSEDNPNNVVQVTFNGTDYTVPSTGVVSVVGTYGTLTIAANGSYSYVANSNNPQGTDVFTYVLEDFDGDQDTAEFSFNVSMINDIPVVTPVTETVDETNLGPIVETGTINVDYGTDGPGTIDPNGTFNATGSVAGGSLTSCGNPVVVTLSGNTYTGVANGVTIFTMEVLDNGDYTFTLLGALDHADGTNPNDVINLQFGVTATDSDGDTSSTTVTVEVRDDAPTIETKFKAIDEDGLETGPVSLTDTLVHDFGNDGEGSIDPTGNFTAKFQMGGPNVTLQSQGDNITVTATANGYVGTAGGRIIFTLDINPSTGQYTYTQFDQIDHPDGTNPDDVIWLKFEVQITDCDGDTDTAIIGIDVHDDGPVANNDVRATDEGQVITGNVTSNDEVGADENGTVTQVTFNGTNYTVPATGNLTVTGNFGTLLINAQGQYTYTANSNNPDGTDVFTYTFQDFDGDTDTANLSIQVSPDFNPTNITGSDVVDETNLTGGTITENGNISVNYHGDGPGTTSGNGSFSASDSTLTAHGKPVTVTFSGNTYTGKDSSGKIIFTMKINANGTYDFKLYDNLDHPQGGTHHDDNIQLRFGVTATDSDGDTGTGIVRINVHDDGPDANNESRNLGRGNSTSGNILSNDSAGTDGGLTLITTPGSYNLTFGRLTIQDDGSYTYVRYGRAGGTDTFDYTIRDFDGDTATATLTLNTTRISGDGGDGGGDGGDGGGDGFGDGCPLVIDLDGDGIELISREDGVMFDIDEDGIADQTAWVGADDGILVLDHNQDGVINNHSEMFGNDEVGGFEILSDYDTNSDGVIDVNDSAWSLLQVWQDLNQDGYSQSNELLTLDQIGITSISLDVTDVNLNVVGNNVTAVGDITMEDGTILNAYDAWFSYESGAYGTDGEQDIFLFQAIAESAATITDFNAAEGDVLDLSLLIEGFDDISEAINDYVYATEVDGSTIISVDVDGSNGPAEAIEVARLEGVTGLTVDQLVEHNNIVTD